MLMLNIHSRNEIRRPNDSQDSTNKFVWGFIVLPRRFTTSSTTTTPTPSALLFYEKWTPSGNSFRSKLIASTTNSTIELMLDPQTVTDKHNTHTETKRKNNSRKYRNPGMQSEAFSFIGRTHASTHALHRSLARSPQSSCVPAINAIRIFIISRYSSFLLNMDQLNFANTISDVKCC